MRDNHPNLIGNNTDQRKKENGNRNGAAERA